MKAIEYFSKYSASGPSSRYRAYQFQSFFSSAGFEFNIHPLFEDRYLEIIRNPSPVPRIAEKSGYTITQFLKRISDLQSSSHDSLFVIEQQLFPYAPYFFESVYLPRKYLIDFDDAIYLTHPWKFHRVLRNAAGVIAGNKTLAEYAQRYNSNTHVVPTVLNPAVYRPDGSKVDISKPVIGWSGLEYNFNQLRILDDVFVNLCKKYDFKIRILSGINPKEFAFPFEFLKWSGSHEAEQISAFDIGVMPLEDNDWTRGKCGLKLLQYMAAGIPAVASPVGVNSEIIQDGINGFLASNSDEWEQKLSELIENSDLRRKIGLAARQTVVEKYSTDVWFPRIVEIYKKYF